MPPPERRWWRRVRAVVGLAIVAFAVRFVARNWDAVRTADLEWSPRALPVLVSLLLVIATYAMLAEAWRQMVKAWGTPLRPLVAARIWVLSSMGKYLPGKVWAVAGLAVLGREAGVPPAVATASAVVLQLLSIATGGLVVAVTGRVELEHAHAGATIALLAVTVGALVAAWLVARVGWVDVVLRRLGRTDAPPTTPPPVGALLLGGLLNAMAWVAYGLALYWLAGGVLADSRLTVELAIAAFAASYLAGFLFLLAPGGIGVRESVFVLLTQAAIGPAQALALAAVSRIGMTVADLLAAAPFILWRGARRDRV